VAEFVDSHCHLDDKQFDTDRAAVMQRARDAGLKWMLSIGTGDGPPDLAVAIRLAQSHPFILSSVGVHPNDAVKAMQFCEMVFEDLEFTLKNHNVAAVGEIGLDYHWGENTEFQIPVFVRQLEIAASARLPVIIHTRDAWKDTLDILRAHWAPTGLPCVMHCFTGTPDEARECIELGFYFGFGGVSTFPKAKEVRESARIVPADRLLLETDSPYLAPVPFRGKRNEPAYLLHTARTVAEVRGVSLEELAQQTTSNFERIFIQPSDQIH
jgi:TatD DNase family protein